MMNQVNSVLINQENPVLTNQENPVLINQENPVLMNQEKERNEVQLCQNLKQWMITKMN